MKSKQSKKNVAFFAAISISLFFFVIIALLIFKEIFFQKGYLEIGGLKYAVTCDIEISESKPVVRKKYMHQLEKDLHALLINEYAFELNTENTLQGNETDFFNIAQSGKPAEVTFRTYTGKYNKLNSLSLTTFFTTDNSSTCNWGVKSSLLLSGNMWTVDNQRESVTQLYENIDQWWLEYQNNNPLP